MDILGIGWCMDNEYNLISNDCQFESDPKQKGEPIEPLIIIKKPMIHPMTPVEMDSNLPCRSREEMIAEVRALFCKQEEKPYIQGFEATFVSNANVTIPTFTPSTGHCNQITVARAAKVGILPCASKKLGTNSVADNQIGATLGAGRKGVAPFDLLKKVKLSYTLCVVDGKLYRFDYHLNYYVAINQEVMERLIWEACPAEVELAGNKSILTGTYSMLLVDPDLHNVRPIDYDAIIPFMNGLLRMDTMEFLPPSPMFFVTYTLQCHFLNPSNTSIECPLFDNYLRDISGGDIQLISRIWETIGLCLTQDMNAKAIFVIQGITGSGKSVLANIIKFFYPKHMQTALDANSIGGKYAKKDLIGKLLCICSDMSPKALSNDAVSDLKKLSGRDTVNTDQKFLDSVDFIFKGKIIMVTNNPLVIKQDDPAFWGRIVAIPFRYQMPEEKKIHGLDEMIRAELPAIASRALAAYIQLRKNGYRFSGNFCINDPSAISAPTQGADKNTLIFQYLITYYEACPDGVVIIEEACNDFSNRTNISINTLQFSPIFCNHALRLYNAQKTRSHRGYSNARSALKGIRRRLFIEEEELCQI